LSFQGTCATSNGVIVVLHDRMPVILSEKDWPKWLGEEPATADELKALLDSQKAEVAPELRLLDQEE
jgi:putative SOS response-associated peptidase YedK